MYEEPTVECDKCENVSIDGESIYCENCYHTLSEENKELKKRIEELEAEQ